MWQTVVGGLCACVYVLPCWCNPGYRQTPTPVSGQSRGESRHTVGQTGPGEEMEGGDVRTLAAIRVLT